MKLFDNVEKNYLQKYPRYISSPRSSFIEVIDYTKYQALSVRQVQSILAGKHIVITNIPPAQLGGTHGPVEFDEAGLCHLRNLDSPIKFQGNAICVP